MWLFLDRRGITKKRRRTPPSNSARTSCAAAWLGSTANSIETAFSKLKARPSDAATRTTDELCSAVADYLSAFTAKECRRHFEAAGYGSD
ncbi:hypothetical protein [Mesorhizobium sp. J428]|uniref:hypothetical protein n=1 Tax=Mesorhizobium sp. J428 TaxID=2898440 RepID=UPI0035AE2D91